MKAWIVREKNGELWLYTHKPKKIKTEGGSEFYSLPDSSGKYPCSSMEINKNLFKDTKWEDGPLMVNIIPV